MASVAAAAAATAAAVAAADADNAGGGRGDGGTRRQGRRALCARPFLPGSRDVTVAAAAVSSVRSLTAADAAASGAFVWGPSPLVAANPCGEWVLVPRANTSPHPHRQRPRHRWAPSAPLATHPPAPGGTTPPPLAAPPAADMAAAGTR